MNGEARHQVYFPTTFTVAPHTLVVGSHNPDIAGEGEPIIHQITTSYFICNWEPDGYLGTVDGSWICVGY